MQRHVTINCDMGEGFGIYRLGDDESLMKIISVANVACGFHASDPNIMAKTVRLAKENRVSVGAHPSLPDLQGFGRREMKIAPEELKNCIIYQVGALTGFLKSEGMSLNHVKPHGSLYGMTDRNMAIALCDAIKVYNVPLVGMAGTLHETVAAEKGIPFIGEFFADLDYTSEGNLIITRVHEKKSPEKIKEKVLLALNKGKCISVDGTEFTVKFDTICVHSDTPGAVEIATVVLEVVKSVTN